MISLKKKNKQLIITEFFSTIVSKLILGFFILNHSILTAQESKNEIIWNIGTADNSISEFALSPNNYKDFVVEGFGGAHRYYVVGESVSNNDFPYILPGPKDGFGGYGYWAGLALNQLPIYFEFDELPETGNCTLNIDIFAVSAETAPLFRCTINGQVYEQQLSKRTSSSLDNLKPDPQNVSFIIPSASLKKGVNEIIFQNMTGNWCAFDAIKFSGPASLKTISPGKTLIHKVDFADWEQKNARGNSLPLLVDAHHLGKNAKVKAIVNGMEKELVLEAGHSVLEFEFPDVTIENEAKVQEFVNGKLKFEDTLIQSSKPLVQLSDYVDQFMGTSGSRWMITPGPRHPMPMIQLSPNNEKSVWKAGYEYQIENIAGFNHTQEWTMAGFLMMPTNGPLQTQAGPEHSPDLGYRSRINKATETSKIGKYSVALTDYDIHVDLTATTRAGFQRYVFSKSDVSRVLIDAYPASEYPYQNAETKITKVSNRKVEGYVHHICNKTGYILEQDYKLYFVLEFDKPFESMGGWVDKAKELMNSGHGLEFENILENRDSIQGSGNVGAFINFKTKENDTILVRSSISLVSAENAWLNLKKEIIEPFNWDFEAVVQNQKNIWNKYLGRIEIETNDYLQKVKFYTNLFRAMSGRVAWGDVNGQWLDMNENLQTFKDPNQRLCSGEFWNTFWNVQQLDQLIAPEFASMQVKSLLEFYDKGGWLSKGIFAGEYSSVMVAEHGIPWIVGAWNSGIKDFDFEKAYEAIRQVQTTLPLNPHSGGGRVGNESLEPYLKYGFVPLQTNIYQSYVSNTLEYAFDDWCAAQASKILNKDDDYKMFLDRSQNWKHIFDSKTGFMRPKNSDGTWYEPFDPYHTLGFVEGNAWQFSWFVPHDMKGLVEGVGKKRFISRLDEAMNLSQKVNFNALGDNFTKYPVNHGNQPNMQSCYLFNYAGAPWLTQNWARAIQENYYGMGPRDAYPGMKIKGR